MWDGREDQSVAEDDRCTSVQKSKIKILEAGKLSCPNDYGAKGPIRHDAGPFTHHRLR